MQKIVKNTVIVVLVSPIVAFHLAILYIVLLVVQALPSARLRLSIVIACKKYAFHLLVAILGRWFPNPVYVKYNKRILKSKKTITISNHCSDYDWMFLLLLFRELGIDDTRILLKKSLGDIPILGSIIRRFNHICLNRARAKDVTIITKAVEPLLSTPQYNLALYPEGTYLFPEAIKNTRKFAKETKVEVDNKPFIPKLVLLPRKTGFNLITKILDKDYEGVIDVTIMMNPYVYIPSEDCPPFEFFFNQKLVMNQFLMVDYVPANQIDKNFLDASFKRKEERIKAYIDYTHGSVTSEEKFIKTINRIEKPSPDDKICTIMVQSSYTPIIYIFPIAIIIFCISSAKTYFSG